MTDRLDPRSLSPVSGGTSGIHPHEGGGTLSARVAVVIPAATCPCAQVERVRAQLAGSDHLVVAWNGPRGRHDCASLVAGDPSCTWTETGKRVGAGVARNTGVGTLGEVQVLAFADSDDRVAPSWLETLTHPLLTGTADIAGGVLRIRQDAHRAIVPGVDYWHAQALFGGNLALTARAWRALGGFDPRMRYCEDTDLAWRAARIGLRVEVVASAVVEVDAPTLLEELRQRFLWGRWAVRLLGKHGLGSDHLPGRRDLLAHKRSVGYCRHPHAASLGQWVGQSSTRPRKALSRFTAQTPAW